MAYNTNNFSELSAGVYNYYTTDSVATITASGYFADFVNVHGGEADDLIIVSDGVADKVVPTANRVTLKVSGVSGNAGTAAVAGA